MTTSLDTFHFLYPLWLWAWLLLPLIIGLLWHSSHQAEWQAIIDPALMPFVLSGRQTRLRYWLMALVTLGWLLAVFALAGPSWEKRSVPVYKAPHSLVVALDLSSSMLAQDVVPQRLGQARFKLIDLLRERSSEQTALVVFAGDAFSVTPLTDDIETIIEQVKNLTPDIMPVQGSQLSPALYLAGDLLRQANTAKGDILLITDGSTDVSTSQQLAQALRQENYYTSILMVGSEEGAPIPTAEGGFLQDQSGQTVMAKLNPEDLQAITDAGEGLALPLTMGEQDIQQLRQFWQSRQPSVSQEQEQQQQSEIALNQGYWFIFPLLLLVLPLFRRGWLVLMVVLILPQPESTWAQWMTPDQQAYQAMQQQQFDQASQLFKHRRWKAAAAYKAGDYATAEALYAHSDDVNDQYNYANALAKQGKLQPAIDAYDRVLAQQAEHEDAQYNRQQVENLLKQQQNQQQNQQSQNNQSQNQQQNSPQQGQNNQQQQESDASSQQNPDNNNGQPGDNAAEQAQQQPEPEDDNNNSDNEHDEAQQAKQQKNAAQQQAANQKEREQQQATEQWLRRIPDDPAGLWRRKFMYQYQQRNPRQVQQPW